MKLGIVALVGITALAAASGSAGAQFGPATGTTAAAAPIDLTLDGALERAAEHSDEVRIARAQAAQARAQVTGARSAALPQVNASMGYNRAVRSSMQFDLPDDLFPGMGDAFSGLPFGREHTWTGGLTLSQTVYAGGRIQASVNMASQAASASALQAAEVGANISLQVTEAYYGAVLAEEMVGIAEASLRQAEEHLERVRIQKRAGNASELDVTRAEVERENLVPRLIEARNGRDLAQANLKRLLNLPADAELALHTSLRPAGGAALPAVGLPSLEDAAEELAQRASVQAAGAQVAITRGQVSIAQAQYRPTVALNANVSQQAFPAEVFPGSNDWRSDVTVGFQVRIPLFDGMKRNADVQSARAQVEQAEMQRNQVQEGIRLEYDRAVRELDRAQAQIAARQRTVSQAEEVYRLTALRFQQGLSIQLEVNDARFSLQQARANEVQAFHDYHVALARAERALGRTPGTSTALALNH
jgi:outer membrane protein